MRSLWGSPCSTARSCHTTTMNTKIESVDGEQWFSYCEYTVTHHLETLGGLTTICRVHPGWWDVSTGWPFSSKRAFRWLSYDSSGSWWSATLAAYCFIQMRMATLYCPSQGVENHKSTTQPSSWGDGSPCRYVWALRYTLVKKVTM